MVSKYTKPQNIKMKLFVIKIDTQDVSGSIVKE